MRKRKKTIFMLLIVVTLLVLQNFSLVRSLIAMSFYSRQQYKESVFARENVKVDIPNGLYTFKKDWYPFVLVFNDDLISRKLNEDVEMSILYNYGAFENDRSTIYDSESNYFNSFYGCYIIKGKDNQKVFHDIQDEWHIEKIKTVPEHDIENLVLKSLGCTDPTVEFNLIEIAVCDKEIAGFTDWTLFNSEIISNSLEHSVGDFKRAYIQYGSPKDYSGKDFPVTKSYGRLYARFFPEKELYILLYVISPNLKTVEETESEFISKTIITY
jgi:hypothetical protein